MILWVHQTMKHPLQQHLLLLFSGLINQLLILELKHTLWIARLLCNHSKPGEEPTAQQRDSAELSTITAAQSSITKELQLLPMNASKIPSSLQLEQLLSQPGKELLQQLIRLHGQMVIESKNMDPSKIQRHTR